MAPKANTMSQAGVERAGDQVREELRRSGCCCAAGRGQGAAGLEQVLDRVDPEEGGEQGRDRRQAADLGRDAAGTPCCCRPW